MKKKLAQLQPTGAGDFALLVLLPTKQGGNTWKELRLNKQAWRGTREAGQALAQEQGLKLLGVQ